MIFGITLSIWCQYLTRAFTLEHKLLGYDTKMKISPEQFESSLPLAVKWAEAKEKVILEIFKNKTSGKYFIGLDDEDGETALMITPLGAVKTRLSGTLLKLPNNYGKCISSRSRVQGCKDHWSVGVVE